MAFSFLLDDVGDELMWMREGAVKEQALLKLHEIFLAF